MGELMGKPFDLVLGRRTYDIFAASWPNASEEEGGKPLNGATKHVVSRTRPTLEWERSLLIEGDVAQGVGALKEQDGPELQGHGSGELVQTLLRHGPGGRVGAAHLPGRAGEGEATVRRGCGPGSAEAGEQLGLQHRRGRRSLRPRW